MKLRADNPMTKVLLVYLIFEVIVYALSSLTMYWVDKLDLTFSISVGFGVALLALIGAARLTKPGGYLIAWIAQFAGVALGIFTRAMFFMGGLFLLLWVLTFVLGKKIERTAQ